MIYKYTIPDWSGSIDMPKNARILNCYVDENGTHIYALIDKDDTVVKRYFAIVGTGGYIDEYEIVRYIATCQYGKWVWHIFEVNN